MNSQNNRLIAGTAITVILGSCVWGYFTQFRAALHNAVLHRQVGEVLAKQAANVLGPNGRIVSISIDPKDSPELKIQLQAFRAKLKELGQYEIREHEMEKNDKPNYGVGSGLSGRQYLQTVKKNANADLFVSFIGAPELSSEEIAELGNKPKLMVESRSGDNVPSLFENNLIVTAVVARQFPGQKPITAEEWFRQHYQILTAAKR